MIKYGLIIGFSIIALFGCLRPNEAVTIEGYFPVKPRFYVSLYNLTRGQIVATDTFQNGNFKMEFERLPKGIYQLVFSWERDLLTPRELKTYARHEGLDSPKYSLTRSCWLDANESDEYHLIVDSACTQDILEKSFLNNGEMDPVGIFISSGAANNTLFNEYLELVDKFKLQNALQKDSLKNLMYQYGDDGNYREMGKIQKLTNGPWLETVEKELLKAETAFLKRNVTSDIVPYIFIIQVNSQKDFGHYKEVYALFSPEIKTALEKIKQRYTVK